VTVQTGLRVSELTALRCQHVHLGTGPHLLCEGKRRKQRCTPLTAQTVAILRAWIRELDGAPASPLFPSRRGTPLSRDAVAGLVAKHVATARERCPS
jgi:integrase